MRDYGLFKRIEIALFSPKTAFPLLTDQSVTANADQKGVRMLQIIEAEIGKLVNDHSDETRITSTAATSPPFNAFAPPRSSPNAFTRGHF